MNPIILQPLVERSEGAVLEFDRGSYACSPWSLSSSSTLDFALRQYEEGEEDDEDEDAEPEEDEEDSDEGYSE